MEAPGTRHEHVSSPYSNHFLIFVFGFLVVMYHSHMYYPELRKNEYLIILDIYINGLLSSFS